MSRINFHSKNGTAEVRGSERSFMAHTVNGVFKGCLSVEKYSGEWILPYLPANRTWTKPPFRSETPILDNDAVDNFLSLTTHGSHLTLNGKQYGLFEVELNTAMLAGADGIKLMCRLHGQCEIHCWVEYKNLFWFADIVQKAFDQKMLRTGQGWEEVIPFLRYSESEVVLSYSVSDSFPYRPSDNKEDRWENLSYEDRWDIAISDLRRVGMELPDYTTREMKPETWANYTFDHSISAFDFRHAAWNKPEVKP